MADRSDSLKRSSQDGLPTTSGRVTLSPLRNRKGIVSSSSPRPSEPSPAAVSRSSVPRRRASMLSLASDISVDSLRSTTDDLFLPRVGRYGRLSGGGEGGGHHDGDSSHLHSLPLFLAIVPAIMGIFFQNGTAIMTDLTLLGIGAIFLNWSIRIPWDWYHSAQAVRHHDSISTEDYLPEGEDDTIIEEESDEEQEANDEAQEGTAKADGEVNADASASEPRPARPKLSPKSRASPEQLSAASQLRWIEIIALLACFLGPVAGAGLLHAIREQLSRPSEGLVSNYNLTIFLLAAEIRPLSHLIKLLQNRTLHLQRVVARSPFPQSAGTTVSGGVPATNEALAALASRIAAIESQGMPHDDSGTGAGAGLGTSPAPAVSREQLVADTRRAMQPDIDALNRAVRRYEKRATLLSLQIDGRLSALEGRVADAIALAAAAERSASGAKRGSAATLLEWLASCVVVPVRAAAWLVAKVLEVPARVAGWLLGLAKELVGMVRGQKVGREKRREVRKMKGREVDGFKGKVKRVA